MCGWMRGMRGVFRRGGRWWAGWGCGPVCCDVPFRGVTGPGVHVPSEPSPSRAAKSPRQIVHGDLGTPHVAKARPPRSGAKAEHERPSQTDEEPTTDRTLRTTEQQAAGSTRTKCAALPRTNASRHREADGCETDPTKCGHRLVTVETGSGLGCVPIHGMGDYQRLGTARNRVEGPDSARFAQRHFASLEDCSRVGLRAPGRRSVLCTDDRVFHRGCR